MQEGKSINSSNKESNTFKETEHTDTFSQNLKYDAKTQCPLLDVDALAFAEQETIRNAQIKYADEIYKYVMKNHNKIQDEIENGKNTNKPDFTAAMKATERMFEENAQLKSADSRQTKSFETSKDDEDSLETNDIEEDSETIVYVESFIG